MGVSDELKTKRGEPKERVRDLTAELADLHAQIAAVDTVISTYEPEWKPEQPQKRPAWMIRTAAFTAQTWPLERPYLRRGSHGSGLVS